MAHLASLCHFNRMYLSFPSRSFQACASLREIMSSFALAMMLTFCVWPSEYKYLLELIWEAGWNLWQMVLYEVFLN